MLSGGLTTLTRDPESSALMTTSAGRLDGAEAASPPPDPDGDLKPSVEMSWAGTADGPDRAMRTDSASMVMATP
jgi:hypothetical protein